MLFETYPIGDSAESHFQYTMRIFLFAGLQKNARKVFESHTKAPRAFSLPQKKNIAFVLMFTTTSGVGNLLIFDAIFARWITIEKIGGRGLGQALGRRLI